MGVEEVQKINSLAKELLKHHIASSSEDAYVQAERMVKGEPPKVSREDETARDIRMLDLKVNSVYKEIVDVQNELKVFKEELQSLRRGMASASNSEHTNKIMHEQPQKLSEQPATPHNEQKKSETPNRPRTGDYEEKDVEIEKFFYYGKK